MSLLGFLVAMALVLTVIPDNPQVYSPVDRVLSVDVDVGDVIILEREPIANVSEEYLYYDVASAQSRSDLPIKECEAIESGICVTEESYGNPKVHYVNMRTCT